MTIFERSNHGQLLGSQKHDINLFGWFGQLKSWFGGGTIVVNLMGITWS